MKALFALATATFITAAVAQDAAKPQFRGSAADKGSATAKEPAAKPAEKDSALTLDAKPMPAEPLSLIPESLEPAPKPKGGALKEPEGAAAAAAGLVEQKIDKTTAAQDELNTRVRMRELKTKVDRDPKIAGELDRANSAKTDYEKREAMRSYYTLLYDAIAKLDPSLKKRAEEAKLRMTKRLDQTRVAPTEPLASEERTSLR